MTSAAVSAWTTSIHELQRLVDGGSVKVRVIGAHDEGTAGSAAARYACKAIMHKVILQPPLTRAVWKKLTQEAKITRKLAALCVQAQQQHKHTAPHLLSTAHVVLNDWLARSGDFLSASTDSAPSNTFRQHLQASGLVQLLAATLTGAQDRLDAAAAAAAASAAAGAAAGDAAGDAAAAGRTTVPNGSNNSGSVSAGGFGPSPTDALGSALDYADVVLRNYFTICTKVHAAHDPQLSPGAALPAAPAALGLVASVYSAGSAYLQQQQQQQQQQAPGAAVQRFAAFDAAHETLRVLAKALSGIKNNRIDERFYQAPGAHELLLSPELVRWLAVSTVVTLLGLDTHADPSSLTSSRAEQQPGSGISLDSLTPLSRSLFDLLGVDIATALLAARNIGKATLKTFYTLQQGYKAVLAYQAWQARGGGPVSGQLLLHLEVHPLLSLFVQQLAAGIPASHPAAAAACALVQTLDCCPLIRLQSMSDLHRLPLAEPYTGPQLALQVWPSPLPPPKQQQQQEQQQEQQQQQPLQQYVLAPSAALLAELLPLLTSWCLKRLQLLHSRRQGQQQQQQQQQQETLPANSRTQHPLEAMGSLVGGYAATPSCPCIPCEPEAAGATWSAMQGWLHQLVALLEGAVVPGPGPGDAGAGAGAPSTPAAPAAVRGIDAGAYSCVLHAQDAVLPHAASIMQALEGVLREAAVQAAAAAASAAGAGAGADTKAAGIFEVAAWASYTLCHNGPHPGGWRSHSALVIAALAAGPGSQAQRQLFSLCASMVKVADWDALSGVVQPPRSTEDWQEKLRAVASYVAATVLAAATQDQQRDGDAAAAAAAGAPTPGSAAAIPLLPCLWILGRCCCFWAEDLQQRIPIFMQQQPAVQDAKQHVAGQQETKHQHQNAEQQQQQQQQQQQEGSEWDLIQYVLSIAQHWLQSGDVAAQLAAAGYAPQALVQQLQQVLGALDVLDTNARNRAPNKAAFNVAMQHLQAAAQALCSFAMPCACNNARCLWLAGLSELGLVSGRSCLCAGCRVARYHDRACQRASWKQHKPVCAALAAAAAAAAAAVAP